MKNNIEAIYRAHLQTISFRARAKKEARDKLLFQRWHLSQQCNLLPTSKLRTMFSHISALVKRRFIASKHD